MEFPTFIEDQQDVCAVAVAALEPNGIEEIGEHIEHEKVQYTKSVSNSWDEEYQPRIVVEEYLTINSGDSIPTQAAKSCINEVVARQNCSRPVVALYRNSGGQTTHDCAPTNLDFKVEVSIAAKRSLRRRFYEVFCNSLDCGFENWPRVPVAVQNFILQRVGEELLQRKIWSPKHGTRRYWENNFKKFGRPSAVPIS